MTTDIDTSRHYVDKKTLYGVLVDYLKRRNIAIKTGTEKPRIPEFVGHCLMLICEKLSSRHNFANYSYRDEMTDDAIENCIIAVDKFNPKKSDNPYGYFSIVAWNAFIRRIQKEKKQQYIKHKNLENMYVTFEDLAPDLAEFGVSWNDTARAAHSAAGQTHDARTAETGVQNHYRVIESFEASLKKRGNDTPPPVKSKVVKVKRVILKPKPVPNKSRSARRSGKSVVRRSRKVS